MVEDNRVTCGKCQRLFASLERPNFYRLPNMGNVYMPLCNACMEAVKSPPPPPEPKKSALELSSLMPEAKVEDLVPDLTRRELQRRKKIAALRDTAFDTIDDLCRQIRNH